MAESNLFWDQLLQLVDEGRVVPVVGQDLLVVPRPEGPMLLYPLLAERLAAYLGVPADGLGDETPLNEVACRYLAGGGQVEDVYAALKAVMSADELPLPESLRKLASIDRFRLFVTTTFDPFLELALNQARFGGQARTRVVSYSPEQRQDLPADWDRIPDPLVFHLFGRLSATPAYAVTQEDVLEFMHSLQSDTRRPAMLLDELDRMNLLIVGSSFGGWLARFFIRVAKRERLLRARGRTDYVADSRVRADSNLVLFLRHFSSRTKVFESGGGVEFVDELHRRWQLRGGSKRAVEAAAPPVTPARPDPPPPAPSEPPPHPVFLSYASEDRAAVAIMTRSLEEAGVDVFFDKTGLEGGEAWDSKLRQLVSRCALFVPVISKHTLTLDRRYFRTEWALAVDEATRAAPGEAFIVPVVIDETSPEARLLPEPFRQLQWQRVSPDAPDEAFVARVRTLYRKFQKRQQEGLRLA